MLSEIGTFLRDYLYMQNENVRNSCFVVSNEVVERLYVRLYVNVLEVNVNCI